MTTKTENPKFQQKEEVKEINKMLRKKYNSDKNYKKQKYMF